MSITSAPPALAELDLIEQAQQGNRDAFGELVLMHYQGAVNIIFKREIADSKDPAATRQRLIDEYRANFANPFRAAALGYIDEIIAWCKEKDER